MDLSLDSDVLAARTGDRVAFGRLVARYGRLVTSISLSTVKNVATSEEVAQDVFLAAWRDLATLRNPASFLPWLRQLTRHRALDAARTARRPDGGVGVDSVALAAVVDPHPGPEDALLQDERTNALSVAFDAIPADAREVLTLYYREGQSVAHVARLLGLREDTVKKRLSRARAALRGELAARFADAVESTAPGESFAQQVIVALPVASPAATLVLGKGAFAALAKWGGVVAASGASIAGLVTGWTTLLGLARGDLKEAVDDRERRELVASHAVAAANVTLLAVGIPLLRHHAPAHMLLWETLLATGTTAVHMAIFLVWRPRAKARRREAELARDPGAAERHAREESLGRLGAAFAALVIAAVLLFAWMR